MSIERDCTNQCKSTTHANIITDAISKRSISDTSLCSFLNYVCNRCDSVVDSSGRTPLHVAASCGRINLVKWLVQNRRSDVNLKDRESGYTALHRSIFYGKLDVAVELIKLGSNINDMDLDCLTCLDHAMKDGLIPNNIKEGELYSWGSNNNNLLGPQQSKQTPDLLDSFHKERPNESVKQICISQFHSVIVTNSGRVFTCGHGQGGRLGLGDEKSVVSPQLIEGVTCVQASISRDHSIFLCSDGNIYTCGLNTYQVLGQVPAPERCLTPKPIKQISKVIQGVCASQYHSVAWGPNCLYTWGLNAGQLGFKNDKNKIKYIIGPKSVNTEMFISKEATIKDVASSNGAVAVCTSEGDVYVLHEYLCRKIASRQLNIVQISIIGGNLDGSLLEKELVKEINSELKVAALMNTGSVSLWQGSDQKLCRCIYSLNRPLIMRQVTMNLNELLLVTEDGEAFKGFIKPRKKTNLNEKNVISKSKKSAFHIFLEKADCIVVNLQKIPKIHRAILISSDLKGRDYCVIQAEPYRNYNFPDIEESQMKENFNLLLKDVDESDCIHDVIIKVDKQCFSAHKYIIANSSQYLGKLIENQDTLVLNGIDPHIFYQLLLYFYTRECDLTKCGELKNKSLRKLCNIKEDDTKTNQNESENIDISINMSAYEYYNKKSKSQPQTKKQKHINPVRLLHELSKKYECSSLQKTLTNLEMDNYFIYNKRDVLSNDKLTFNRLDYSQFYDVSIKCLDNKRLNAHKCILSARLEYFNNIFTRWNKENISEVSFPFPKSTAETLLEYLYTDSLSNLNSSDTEHLFNVLILADQLFVTRLKEQCELLLSELLTLKNVIQLLSFADIYSANKLKYCCMKFITANVTPLLESRSLNDLNEELLKELSDFYFEDNKKIQCRVITPYSTAECDEVIESIASAYPVSLDDEVDLTPIKVSTKKRHRLHKTSTSEKNNSVSESSLDNVIQFPDEPEVQVDEMSFPARLKSINLASQIVKDESVQEDYVSLNLNASFEDSFDFPELGSPLYSSNKFSPHSPNKNEGSRSKIVKMSQKQRKRLSSENKSVETIVPATPKNPWKNIPDPSSPQSPESHITDIIYYEKKQKENLVKLTTRPLIYTQIEDKAIDELHRFYNTENSFDELIVIERVNMGAVATPIWVPRQK